MIILLTYQDFEKAKNKADFISSLIENHRNSQRVRTARLADEYDAQRNTTINEFARIFYTRSGKPVKDPTASNHKIASNLFHRLNTQRCNYSLGNGVTFNTENLKESLGIDFDTCIKKAGYKALIHGESFVFKDLDRCYVFPLTEFVPLYDEYNGRLRAGVRYWQLDVSKPLNATLYEVDGFTQYRSDGSNTLKLEEEKRAYRITTEKAPADEEAVVISEENYSDLPIVPVYGNDIHQSTLVGMRAAIDAYDLIRSGFANDLSDCAEVYWIVSNNDGMDESDLAKFRDRLKLYHMATADDGDVKPYTLDMPYTARKEFLESIRSGIFEDFGALDVHVISAGSTNDHIDAAYQAMDDNADDFEYQIIQSVQAILALTGVDDTPSFKRNRISNQHEQADMVLSASMYLDEETILNKLPFITPDEIKTIMERKGIEDIKRFTENDEDNDEGDNLA